MTREEAIALVKKSYDSAITDNYGNLSHGLVDSLIALGVFKPDDPVSLRLEGKLAAAFSTNRTGPVIFSTMVREALDLAGLELVEKK